MAKKISISNKDLKTPDKIQAFQERVITYVYENRKRFLLFLGLIVLVSFFSGGYYYYSLQCEKKAQEMYSKAFNPSDLIAGNEHDKAVNTDSIALLQELISKYPRSNAAVLAQYNLGNMYFTLNELDKSIDAYEWFLQKSSNDNMLTSLAYYGLGYCYEGKKDYRKALESFEKSSSHGSGSSYLGMNYQNIARIYEEMNKRDKAKEYYKRALDLTADPIIEKLIKRKISMLTYE